MYRLRIACYNKYMNETLNLKTMTRRELCALKNTTRDDAIYFAALNEIVARDAKK